MWVWESFSLSQPLFPHLLNGSRDPTKWEDLVGLEPKKNSCHLLMENESMFGTMPSEDEGTLAHREARMGSQPELGQG